MANEIFVDSFEDAANLSLTLHVSDSAHHWGAAATGSTAGTDCLIASTSNEARGSGGGSLAQVLQNISDLTIASTDYEVEFDINFRATPGNSVHAGIAFRSNGILTGASKNFMYAGWYQNAVILQTDIGNTVTTQVTTPASGMVNGSTRHVLARVATSGGISTYSLYVGGSVGTLGTFIGSYVDSANTITSAPGVIGIYTGAALASAFTTTNTPHIDNLMVRLLNPSSTKLAMVI